jgi:hypothetical protein
LRRFGELLQCDDRHTDVGNGALVSSHQPHNAWSLQSQGLKKLQSTCLDLDSKWQSSANDLAALPHFAAWKNWSLRYSNRCWRMNVIAEREGG